MDPIILVPITLIFVACMILGRNELVRRRLACPGHGRIADVSVVQRAGRPDKPVDVTLCSLLPGAKKIDCDRACLKQSTPDEA